jgi:hypothetical protein
LNLGFAVELSLNDLGNYFSRPPKRVISTEASRRIFFLREAKSACAAEKSLFDFSRSPDLFYGSSPRSAAHH